MEELPRAKRLCVMVRTEANKTPQEKKSAGESLRRDAARAVHSELFPDIASACLHFGLDVSASHRNVRYHVNAYAEQLAPKVPAFSGLSSVDVPSALVSPSSSPIAMPTQAKRPTRLRKLM